MSDPPEILLDPQALGERLIYEAMSGKAAAVARLIADGAQVDFANAKGVTPLMVAAGWDRSGIVKLLLKKGATVQPANRASGCNALMYACIAGSCDCMQHLLEAGACIDAADVHGRTALMLAATVGNMEAVSLLCRAGADTNAKDHFGLTAMDLATREGHRKIVAHLRSQGALARKP